MSEASEDSIDETESIKLFRNWFLESGGEIHPDIYFSPSTDESGISVCTRRNLPSEATIVSCPFALAITLETVRDPLQHYCQLGPDAPLSARQRISTYISLHWIVSEKLFHEHLLRHGPYLKALPKPERLSTPLYFSPEELELFRGTNLYGAAQQQRLTWEIEWRDVCALIQVNAPTIAGEFTWEMYLAAATYLSSRAFPSTLLSSTPSLTATPSSYPVLLPGIDTLNHARGQPVTWGISKSHLSHDESITVPFDLCISLTSNTVYSAHSELFNNYGLKPNSSLILGYGFALEDNPDDTIMLKIGSGSEGSQDGPIGPTKGEHEIGREARGAEKLWDDVRQRVAEHFNAPDEDESTDENAEAERAARDLQLDMQGAETLTGMVLGLRARLPRIAEDDLAASLQGGIRLRVREMWKRYVKGQVDILDALLVWLEGKDREAMRRAHEMGIDVVFAEDDPDGD